MGFFATITKFILIVATALLGIAIILGAILLIFPGVNYFGLHYINGDGKTRSDEIALTSSDYENADTIRVTTKGYDIVVRVNTDDELVDVNNNLTVVYSNKYNGFVWGEVDRPTYSCNIIEESGKSVISFEIAEPDGWLMRGDAKINLIVAPNTLADKTLELITSHGEITLGGTINNEHNNRIAMKNLNISSDTGKVVLKDSYIQEYLAVTKQSGHFETQTALNGVADIEVKGFGNIIMKDLGTGADPNSAMISIKAGNCHLQLGDINGDFDFEAEKGLLEVGNISGDVNLKVKSCVMKMSDIGGSINLDGGTGYLNIGKLTGEATLEATDGDITIDETNGNVTAVTVRGSVMLKNVTSEVGSTKLIDLESVYGDLTVNLAETAPAINLKFRNRHGDIEFTNLRGTVDALITSPGGGSIKGNFSEVNGTSKLESNTGSVNVVFPVQSFYLKWSSQSATDILLGGLESAAKNSGSEFQEVNLTGDASEDDKVTVISSTGKITLKTA